MGSTCRTALGRCRAMRRFPLVRAGLALLAAAGVSVAVAQTATLGGATYTNKGIVGAGRVDHTKRDKFGETFGSLSGLALDLRSWKRVSNNTYTGILYAQPDRGYVKSGVTTNYQPRLNRLALTFKPDTNGSSNQDQATLTLADTTLLTEADGTPLTGMDPSPTTVGTRAGFPKLPQVVNGRLSLDAEGLVLLPDGSFFVCDEYGPYLYRFSAAGVLLGVIRPPEAAIPKRNLQDSFSSDSPAALQPAASPSQPTNGRENNKGLEGLSLSADGRTLYALMQSATRQDGGAGGVAENRYVRLFAYDVTNPASAPLTGEWVLPLPFYTDANRFQQIAEQHECLVLNSHQFLVLAHDGNGRGASVTRSLYRAVLLYDIGGPGVPNATNIAGTVYDTATAPVAQNGILNNAIVPARFEVLVNLNDETQLAKFGLNNNANDNSETLSNAWESLALAPVLDPAAPDDYFLFIGNDNNFSTGSGFQGVAAYSASPNLDTMVLVYRVTLPGVMTVPNISTLPSGRTVGLGAATTFSAAAMGGPTPTLQWSKDGVVLAPTANSDLTLAATQPRDAGLYLVTAANANGSVASAAAILGLTSGAKLTGLGTEFSDIFHPGTGFTYDQILLGGSAASVTADPGQILRISYIDLNDDIVQVEFSGSGTLSLVLDAASGPAAPVSYNQATTYMKGHAGIVLAGANVGTNLTVFSVGRANAVNQALFRSDVTYDGFADLAFIAITSTDGKFGGLRAANASLWATKGLTGIYAPGVQFTGPVFISDINALADATPVFNLGSGTDVRVTGGDLLQTNGRAVQVSGITQAKFTAGSNSHGTLFSAQNNQGRLEQNGLDVTAQIVVNPTP